MGSGFRPTSASRSSQPLSPHVRALEVAKPWRRTTGAVTARIVDTSRPRASPAVASPPCRRRRGGGGRAARWWWAWPSRRGWRSPWCSPPTCRPPATRPSTEGPPSTSPTATGSCTPRRAAGRPSRRPSTRRSSRSLLAGLDLVGLGLGEGQGVALAVLSGAGVALVAFLGRRVAGPVAGLVAARRSRRCTRCGRSPPGSCSARACYLVLVPLVLLAALDLRDAAHDDGAR